MKSCPSACALLAVTAAAFGLDLPASLERAGFERNEGQFDTRVRFVSRARGVDLYLQQDRVVFAANNSQLGKLEWKGAKRPRSVEGVHALPTRSNYYTGSDRSRWLTGVAHYEKVLYRDVYPGIDLLFYGAAEGFEFDFLIAPGADPNRIRLALDSFDRVKIEPSGDVLLTTGKGEVRLRKPVLRQGDRIIDGGFRLAGKKELRFRVSDYDTGQPLVIDPVVQFNTYVGGTGFDTVYDIAADAAGNLLMSGHSNSTGFFPPAVNRRATEASGFVAKLNPSGTQLLYVTYLGEANLTLAGSGSGIAVDTAGNAYVTGNSAGNLPVTPGAFQSTFGGVRDVYATKLSPTGALVYSTYVGGSGGDSAVRIAVDASGNAYIAGGTNSTNYPTTAGALKRQLVGTSDGFVTKLNATGTGLAYSTLVGGNQADSMTGIVVDSTGAAYVTGSTTSSDYPTTAGVLQPAKRTAANDVAAFIGKLDPTGARFLLSTFLSGSFFTQGGGIALDAQGNIHVAGLTRALDFPTTAGVVKPTSCCGAQHAFISKLNPQATAMLASTYFGGTGEVLDFASDIRVDANGGIYVTGGIGVSTFPNPGPSDTLSRGFLAVFSPDLTQVTDMYNAGRSSILWGLALRNTGAAVTAARLAGRAADPVKQSVCVAGRTDGCTQTITPGAVGRTCTPTTAHGVAACLSVDAPSGTGTGTGGGLELVKSGRILETREVEWTIVVKNVGQREVTGIRIIDDFDLIENDLDKIGFVFSGNCRVENERAANLGFIGGFLEEGLRRTFFNLARVTCTVGVLKPGESHTVTIRHLRSVINHDTRNLAYLLTDIISGDIVSAYAKIPEVPLLTTPTLIGTLSTPSEVIQAIIEAQGLTAPTPGGVPVPVVLGVDPAGDAVKTWNCPNGICTPSTTYTLPPGSGPIRMLRFRGREFPFRGKEILTLNNGTGTVGAIDPETGRVTVSPVGEIGSLRDFQTFVVGEEPRLAVLRIVGASSNQGEVVTFGLREGSPEALFSRLLTRSPVGSFPSFLFDMGLDAERQGRIAVSNTGSNDVSILTADGAGGFKPAVSYPAGPGPAGIVGGDWNKDGLTDLAVTNPGADQVSILLADPAIGFRPPVAIQVGVAPLDLAVGDFNGDSIVDLAVGNFVGRSITTLRGDGRGGFTALPETPTKGTPLLFGVGDLNGDGGPDLAVPILGPPGISVLLTTPPTVAGVANAASYAAGGVSPGEIVVVAGARIGPEQLMGLELDENGNVKTRLGGTRFLFDGVAAPLVYDSYSQSGVIVPYGVAGRANTQLVVETDGVRSAPLTLPVIPAKPGLFSANASGTGQGAVLNQDSTRNSMENPAEKGSIVVVFGTGSGMNDPPSVDGRITAAAGKPVLPFSANFGGMTAEVLYLGPAPALVAGVFQANLRVPANVASGNIPVAIRIGTAVSQTGLTVAVK